MLQVIFEDTTCCQTFDTGVQTGQSVVRYHFYISSSCHIVRSTGGSIFSQLLMEKKDASTAFFE